MSWSALNFTAPAGNASAVDGASSTSVATFVAHPWVLGVGEGDRLYQYLSFPNAVKHLLQQVNLSDADAALGIAVCASNYSAFADQLKALNVVFPTKTFQQMQRRAAALAKIETSKWVLNEIPGNVQSVDIKTNALPVMTLLHKTSHAETAAASAVTFKGSNPAANLNNFKAEKDAHDNVVASALAEAKALLSGSVGWSFYAESDIAGAMQTGHPGHEYTLTLIMLMTGSTSDLALLKEVLS